MERSGTDETFFGWVAANNSLRYFPSNAVGYMEMGGQSTQIAIPLSSPEDCAIAVEVAKNVKAEKVAENATDEEEDTKVQVVNLGFGPPQSVFLGSYRLGGNAGYKEFQTLLLNSEDPKVKGSNVCVHV